MKNILLLGALFSLLSALCYAMQTSVVKLAGADISVPTMVFVQSAICLFLTLFLVLAKDGAKALDIVSYSQVKKQHLIRTIFSLGISYFLFIAIKKMPYFDSILLYNAFPLFIPVVAVVLLKEKINHTLWPFVILGFFGVMLTLKIDKDVLSLPALFALASALSAALSIVMMRKISARDSSIKSLYYYFLLSTIISGVIAIPDLPELIHVHYVPLLQISVLFFLVQYLLVLAATYTLPQIVSCVYYSNIIFSLIFSYFLFQESITLKMYAGMVCIVLGGAGVIYCQRRKIA